MSEVTLSAVLAAREARVARQQRLLQAGFPLICLNLNIAGPVKRSALIDRAFACAMERVDSGLTALRLTVRAREIVRAETGCEAMWSVAADAPVLKRLCMQLEEQDALGRLLDLDVIGTDGCKLDRPGLERPCLICGSAGRGCASRRIHSVSELQAKTRAIITAHLQNLRAEELSAEAVRALLDEVCATPKPGLVDRADNGSHTDMDIFTFTASAAALGPYFRQAALLGMETRGEAPEAVFFRLQALGLEAERRMNRATGGVNTHRGAIFTLGLLCCAAGRLDGEAPYTADACLQTAADLAQDAAAEHRAALARGEAATNGDRACLRCGVGGVRGEAAAGFPALRDTALPALSEAERAGLSLNDACVWTLLRLIAVTADTNMIARGGEAAAGRAAERVREVLRLPPQEAVAQAATLNAEFTKDRLSPGGCADLLAAALFLSRTKFSGTVAS